MNTSYLKAIDKITLAYSDINRLWEDGQLVCKSFEDKEAYAILEDLLERMDMAAYRLKRFASPAIEGKLQEDPVRKKFELIQSDTGKGVGYQFSCGDYLEIWDDEEKEWRAGRVEHTSRDGYAGYYFFCPGMGNPFLYTGMKARIRQK